MPHSPTELSPAKRALREARLKGLSRATPILPVPRDGDPPLSFAQERLWFMDRLQPGGTAYNLVGSIWLRAADERALERAVGEVVRRHESLRTTIREVDGVPVQVVAPFTGFALPVEDFSALDPGGREAAVRRRTAGARAHVFDLEAGPLFRVWLFRLGAGEHLLLHCLHHVVGDQWSQKVIAHELRVLHDAYRQGLPSPLPEPPVQYADYAAWQRAELRAAEAPRLAYWTRRLAGAPELLTLPTDRPRPPVPSRRGARVPVAAPPAVVDRLRELASREGATLNMVALAAYQLLLARHAGMDDVAVGTPAAGRGRKELEGVVGMFVNMLVVRADVSGDPSFRGMVGRVREVALGAYQHQDLPFERLVAALRPERSLSHNVLFQVVFQLEESAKIAPPEGGLEPDGPGTAQFDLSLTLAASPDGFTGFLEYATDLFERATAERMAARYGRLLEQVAADPDRPLSTLEMMDAAERRRVVEEWNATDAAPPAGRCVHALFEEWAARTPDAPAAGDDSGTSLTYRQLNARANRLAHHLRRLGVGPDARVGICLERGVEMAVSLLAVLKAGGAYVPVDPASPAPRLRRILADSGTALVLARTDTRGALPDEVGVVDLDAIESDLAAESDANPEGGATPGSLAYVIHTSGSTGAPKGVGIEHRALVSTMAWFVRDFGFAPGDRVLQKTPVVFDASVWEFHAALLSGAELVFARPEGERDAAYLARTVRERGITVLQLAPPSLLRAMLEEEEFAACASLRHVFSGGEALPGDLCGRLARVLPGARLVNLYGPAECAVVTSTHLCSPEDAARAVAPIGRPVAHTRSYVVDAALRPVPVGVPGELCIGGAQVGRGYLGRPGMTAERFVPDPLGDHPGARLYRTGDRARWLGDGTLEYLGRMDEQVKVRGMRVEPGEVEAALRAHPGVRDARVTARADAPGETRLVAYVVGDVDAEALRRHLRESLPDYMVPAAFVALDALPLTATGKLDRAALPAPEFGDAERYAEPRTPVERVLAGIWAEVLRLERVGVRESFFELGGDSILSIQVVSRARRAGLDLTPRLMVEYQTIAELAAAAGALDGPAARIAEQGRVRGSVRPTPIQAWLLEQEQPAPWHFNQDAWWEVDPALDDAVLEAALRAVLERHDALRLRFRRSGAGWEEWHADEVGIALERVDLSHLPQDERGRARDEAVGERQGSLDLERGPVGRAVLFGSGDGRRELLLILNHLVVDGVSWRILRDDLGRACALAAAGEPIDLGPKGTSYRQWAETLEAYAAGNVVGAEIPHWLAQGPGGVPALPRDGEGGRTIAESRAVAVSLDAEETRALLQEVPPAYRTRVDDVLLCALAEAVGAWAGGSRIRLALEGHGREEEVRDGVDLSRTVGWFTSVYPVVLDLAGAAGAGDRLKRVKEQMRAVPMRGLGYGVLRHLSPDPEVRRALSAHVEPEIVFNYHGQVDYHGQADGGAPAAAPLRALGPRPWRRWAPENRRPHLLGVDAKVAGGCLRLTWTYGEGTHRRETIERVAAGYLQALRGLIAHCREEGAGGYTPSDFPLAGLAQGELDALLAGRRGVEDLYPLSPMQEGILFHTVTGGEPQPYQVRTAMRLEGSLDPDLLRRAWAEVVARHAVLRTAFVRGPRGPLQRVDAAASLPWTVGDWRELPPEAQEAALGRFLADDHAHGFELDRAPLMRVALFRAGEAAWWMVWSHHHLLMDGWSAARVHAEVFALHRAWSAGPDGGLERVRRYRDYVGWLARQDGGAAERYWRRVLSGFGAPTPVGGAPAAGPGGRHARRSVALGAERALRLEEAARRLQVTLNTVAQGAWALLLSRSSGEEDVVFGSTVSGRPPSLPGVEEMVGLFINTLPVRARVRGDERLGAWLGELQRAQAETREYEHSPLVQVQRWSDVPPGSPLFESIIIFENYPRVHERPAEALPARDASPGAEPRATRARTVEWTTYPLTLWVDPRKGLQLSLTYDERRFDADAIDGMLRRLERVLDQVAAGGDPRLSELETIGEAERRQVLEEWNRTEADYPDDSCLHELFEAQAERTPEAAAVVFGGGHLTFAELDRRADRLARRLRSLGVGPEVRVGICVERSPGLVVAMLAVLKAGGAYVPLDPAYPPDRLRYMLDDSGARVLLTRAALHEALPADRLPVVLLDGPAESEDAGSDDAGSAGVGSRGFGSQVAGLGDADLDDVGSEDAGSRDAGSADVGSQNAGSQVAGSGDAGLDDVGSDDPGSEDTTPAVSPRAVDPDGVAYVVYTSGSTGRPKGVAGTHRAMVNRLQWMWDAYPYAEGEVCAMKTAPSFVDSVAEVFGPLLRGVPVAVVPEDAVRDVPRFVETLAERGCTRIVLVPSLLRALLDRVPGIAERLPRLRLWVSSGEPLAAELCARFRERLPEATLLNLYGSSEVAADVTAWEADGDPGGRVPVGRPIANVRLRIVDAALRPVPVGVPGEVYVGGAALARGYLGRPGLTAERFVPDPFGAEPGARLYRTGDVGRWRPDGTVELVGRADHQVKLRGFRIEPGEIAARLAEHAAVREAVVLVRGDASGERRLVAYYAGEDAGAEALRLHLAARVPEHMVPAAFVRLDALPLTPNGKLDRAALPAPGADAYASRAYEPPAGDVEEALAEIWTELLGVERVGRRDSFFELGGHSLHAVTLMERLRRRGLLAEVRALFATPVLAELAATVVRDESPARDDRPESEETHSLAFSI